MTETGKTSAPAPIFVWRLDSEPSPQNAASFQIQRRNAGVFGRPQIRGNTALLPHDLPQPEGMTFDFGCTDQWYESNSYALSEVAGHEAFAAIIASMTESLVDRLHHKLLEDRSEIDTPPDALRLDADIDACTSFATRLLPHLVLTPQLKCGAFVEDDATVALVIQSLQADRRLSCRFSSAEQSVRTLSIDEDLQSHSASYLVDDAKVPKELAAWLISRA